MTNRKMIKTKFGDVPKELYDKIPSLKEHPEMLNANAKLQKLRDDLQALRENIQKHSTEANVGTDAQKLLAGASLEKTKVATLQELSIKKEVLERAVNLQIENIQKLKNRLIPEGLAELEPLGKKFAKAVIDALAAAEKSLTQKRELSVILRMKGYGQMYLPAKWKVTPLENLLLSGGCFPRLALYLQECRKQWNIKAVGSHIKG